jgi:hypothetical protein
MPWIRRALGFASVAASLSCAPTRVEPPEFVDPNAVCLPPSFAEHGPADFARMRSLHRESVALRQPAMAVAEDCRRLCDVSIHACTLEQQSCALAKDVPRVCEYADVCEATRCSVVAAWCLDCASVHTPR